MEQTERDPWVVEQQATGCDEQTERNNQRIERWVRHVNVAGHIVDVADVLVITTVALAIVLIVFVPPNRIAMPNLRQLREVVDRLERGESPEAIEQSLGQSGPNQDDAGAGASAAGDESF